jgi:hypothetical protein
LKKIKLHITDERMLQLPEILKADQVIRFRQEFCDAIEMPKQNIRNIRYGLNGQRFTVDQIRMACEAFGVDGNWVLGFTDKVYRTKARTKR